MLATSIKPFCKCDKIDSPEAEIERSDLVMIGDVMAKEVILKHTIEKNGLNQTLRLTQYKIKVYKSYK